MGVDILMYEVATEQELKSKSYDELRNNYDYFSLGGELADKIDPKFISVTLMERLDLDETFARKGLTYNNEIQFTGNPETGYTYVPVDENGDIVENYRELAIVIPANEMVWVVVECPCIVVHAKCLGCLRDGANAKFHEDDCLHNEPYISSLDILTEHWEKYFSDNEYTRDEFKSIFIDKFVEGKHIVCYE